MHTGFHGSRTGMLEGPYPVAENARTYRYRTYRTYRTTPETRGDSTNSSGAFTRFARISPAKPWHIAGTHRKSPLLSLGFLRKPVQAGS